MHHITMAHRKEGSCANNNFELLVYSVDLQEWLLSNLQTVTLFTAAICTTIHILELDIYSLIYRYCILMKKFLLSLHIE